MGRVVVQQVGGEDKLLHHGPNVMYTSQFTQCQHFSNPGIRNCQKCPHFTHDVKKCGYC